MADSTSAATRRTVVVGIAGGSASGKTTFTSALVPALAAGESPLHVEVFGMDRYFYRGAPGGPTITLPSTGEVMPNNNHPNSADNARMMRDVADRLAQPDAPDVLIIEGLMALAVPEIRDALDVRIFVELDADVRALRRLLRDMGGGRGSADPQWIATYYRECARIGHNEHVEPSRVHADLILRGDGDLDRTVPMVAAVIRERRTDM